MSDYEIKSVGGITLYVAKGAADVRAAVIAAARLGADLSGADLSGANLSRADLAGADLAGAYLAGADLSGANLWRAYLSRADLSRADLAGAYLAGADLSGANLSRADLAGADLSGADLSGAYLSRADGLRPERVNDLLMLLDQPGPIRAYKLVTAEFTGPTYSSITYKVGKVVTVKGADKDANVQCGAGINVATLPWVIREWQPGYHILIVEFTAKDIAAIPIGDGKFRLTRCKVVGEKDLVELGLVEPGEEVAA